MNLIDDDSGRRYSTRLSALIDSRPEPANVPRAPRQILQMLWNSLPGWVQFGASPTAIGELRGYLDTDIETKWWANIRWHFRGDPEAMFISALQWLDDSGFDRTGEQNPDRSYFVSILEGGASLNLHARSERGDKAILTVLDTLGHMSVNINYEPPSGTAPPTAIRTSEMSGNGQNY